MKTPAPATSTSTLQPKPTLADETSGTLSEDELGNLPLPPEIVSPELAELETWDESAQESGYRVTPEPAEDEAEFPEALAEEGLDEAEEELREAQDDEEERIVEEAEEEDEVADEE